MTPHDMSMLHPADAATTAHGFELLREENLQEANSIARLYRHVATGAEFLSLINDDENKVFGVTFRTPPNDSTGVAHILEHLVLRGSRKYPVKDILVEVGKGSLATFLNAMTYPDKTCYPVASQNLADFYNLVDVYLDTVLYPRLSKLDFAQEGWHYSLASREAPLGLRGVVFNEMKGAYSTEEVILSTHVNDGLYPDTIYRHSSGGDPAVIPDLTYAQLQAFHSQFYHPSNGRFFFYGNDDPEERLRLLAQWLAPFQRMSSGSLPALQPRLVEPRRAQGTYMADTDEGEAPKHMLAVSWLVDDALDPQTRLGLRILTDILLESPAAPLRQALLDSGMGVAFVDSGVNFDFRQGLVQIALKGIQPGETEKVETTIFSTLRDLASSGIDELTVAAAVNTAEFRLRENNTGWVPRGIALMLRSLESWLYEGDPLGPLAFGAPLAAIKQSLAGKERYFEGLIRRYLLDNQHRVTVTLLPDPEMAARDAAAERQSLDAARAAMTPADIEATLEATRALKIHEEKTNSPEALATLPTLKIAELPRKAPRLPLEEATIRDTRVLWHELPTSGIAYLDLAFDLRILPPDLLPYAKIFGTALLKSGAGKQNAVELAQRIGLATGGIDATVQAFPVYNRARAASRLFLRAKVMPEKADALFGILEDVLFSAHIDDRARLRQLVLEAKATRESNLVRGGSYYVDVMLRAGFNEAGWAENIISGVAQLPFLRELARRIDEDWDSVKLDLERLRGLILNRTAMLCNLTVEPSMRSRLEVQMSSFLAALPEAPVERLAWSFAPASEHIAMTIPAKVNNVGKGADLRRLGFAPTAGARVISNYLTDSWLYQKIRVQGGAYGGFCQVDVDGGSFTYGSYWDPNIMRTLAVYDQTAEFLRGLDMSQAELDRSIIGSIGMVDTYLLPDAKGWQSMMQVLAGHSDELIQRRRDEIFSVTPRDLRDFAEVLEEVATHGSVAVLGGEEAIGTAESERPGFLAVSKLL